MKIADVIGILSLIAGIIGIYYTISSKSKSAASFICHSIIPIFPTFQEKFNKIKIQYAGNPISENLIYCKFSFINTSNLDITNDKISKPLEIEFPSKYIIIECNTTERATNDLNVNTVISKNRVTLNWDLLKQNEYVTLELFVDALDKTDLITVYNYSKRLNLNYRIANLNKIQLLDYKSIKPNKNVKIITKAIPFYLGLLVICSLFAIGLYNGINSFINPKISIDHEITYPKTGEKVNDFKSFKEKVIFLNRDKKVIDTLTVEDAKRFIILSPKITFKKNDFGILAAGIFGVSIFLFAIYLFTKETIEDIKMNNILKKIKNS
jgi:hypothetical protein